MGFLDFALGMLTGMARAGAKQNTTHYQRGFRTCPSCGHSVKNNAIRCSHCNYYFKRYSKPDKFNINKKESRKIKREYSGKRRCPNCGKRINKKAVRCKYCHYYIKKWPKNNNEIKETTIKTEEKPKVKLKSTERSWKKCPNCNNNLPISVEKCYYCGYKFKE